MTPSTQDARATGLVELAERCEQATGADRELDFLIAAAVGVIPDNYERGSSHSIPLMCFWHTTDSHAPYFLPQRYTASLDAAMSLVPEGWRWWKAGDGQTGGSRMVVTDTAEDGRFTVLGECPCPDTTDRNALALVAAALRARSLFEKDK